MGATLWVGDSDLRVWEGCWECGRGAGRTVLSTRLPHSAATPSPHSEACTPWFRSTWRDVRLFTESCRVCTGTVTNPSRLDDEHALFSQPSYGGGG